MDKALIRIKNKSILINLLARRVRQLNKNARPLVEKYDADDNITLALREVIEGKIYPVFKSKDQQE